jgi:hypothetical protein
MQVVETSMQGACFIDIDVVLKLEPINAIGPHEEQTMMRLNQLEHAVNKQRE